MSKEGEGEKAEDESLGETEGAQALAEAVERDTLGVD